MYGIGAVMTVAALITGLTQSVSARPLLQSNPRLSEVESVRCLATLIDALAAIHELQKRYEVLPQDDFTGRMTALRLMSGESAVRRMSIKACEDSRIENVRESAETAGMVLERYRSVFDGNVALYEDAVRIFTVPHALTETESKTIAENRIKTSRFAAAFTQLSELLKDASSLMFVSCVVEAPGDAAHTALNMTAGERDSFRADLRRAFGDFKKQQTVNGVEQAALALVVHFEQDWRLAK